MKSRILKIILILISFIIPNSVYALSTSDANEKIDITKKANLTLNYIYDDYNLDNVNVEIYYVASVSSDFRYELSSAFSEYSIKINGIKTDKEWATLEETLNAYINTGNIKETVKTTIKNNKVELSDLDLGLYFVKVENIDTEDYSLIFDSFLISLPDLREDGYWNYNLEVYPKVEEHIPKYDDINYTIIKEWIDDAETRPNSIEIEIYKNKELVDTKTLSKDNNWKYEWITEDDGSIWTVIEKNVPKGYEVSINNKNNNFIIVNIDPEYTEENPSTFDNIKLYFYLLFGSVIGLILLATSIILQKKQVK